MSRRRARQENRNGWKTTQNNIKTDEETDRKKRKIEEEDNGKRLGEVQSHH